ncbi:MAG: cation:proton antiporter [Polaromonas sp.]|nr:cation:proton antiporter [Polaromonas sp.]
MTDETLLMLGCVVVGLLLIVMTMTTSFISRLPLSAAMLYLAVGVGLGPAGLGLLVLDPLGDASVIERLTEIAVLISLFTAGLKLEMPLSDRRWRIPVQLASISMVVTVAAVTALGFWIMDLPLGAAVLLGAILAPTDPVLASDVQVSDPGDRDRLRFGLTGEGGLNDGTAFPFVMLGLGLLSLHDLGAGGWRWWAVDVLWAVTGGLAIGYLLGALVGRVILYLRTHHREALGSDEFMALGLIALAYGLALLCHTYGFLAVFAAGLALRRIDNPAEPVGQSAGAAAEAAKAPGHMMREVERFNAQLERFAEVAVVLVVGALLVVVDFGSEVVWFVPVLFLLIRPLAVYLGLAGTRVERSQRPLMAWFGIRGIGSIYYLMYAITHDLEPELAKRLLSLTLAVVVASVIAHGVSVTPLMKRYKNRKGRDHPPSNGNKQNGSD